MTMAEMSCSFTHTHFLLKLSTTLCQCIKGVPINALYQLMLTTLKYSVPSYPSISTLEFVPKLIFDQLPIVPSCRVTGVVKLNTIAFDRLVQLGEIAVDVLPMSHRASTVSPLMFSHVDKHCLSSGKYYG